MDGRLDLDKTYAACNKGGWSFAGTFAGLERGGSSSVSLRQLETKRGNLD
jgi:hypothetical protein